MLCSLLISLLISFHSSCVTQKLTVEETAAALAHSSDEGIGNEYYAYDDFDTESDIALHVIDNEDIICKCNSDSANVLPGPCGDTSAGRRKHGETKPVCSNSAGWSRSTDGFKEKNFIPHENPSPKNIPENMNVDSTPIEYFTHVE